MTTAQHAEQRRLIILGKAIHGYNSFRMSNKPSRRFAKSKANGTGQWLKHSRIVSETGLEQIFNVPEHQKRL